MHVHSTRVVCIMLLPLPISKLEICDESMVWKLQWEHIQQNEQRHCQIKKKEEQTEKEKNKRH